MKTPFSFFEELFESKKISLLELEFGRYLISIDPDLTFSVLVAGMFCVKKQQEGHLCSELKQVFEDQLYASLLDPLLTESQLKEDLLNSKLIGVGGEVLPLILENENLYIQKFWEYERELSEWLTRKANILKQTRKEVIEYSNSLFDVQDLEVDNQKIAVLLSLYKELVVISGGPGTGKTFTLRKLIQAQFFKNHKVKISLAAPTGKAAQRLNEALQLQSLDYDIEPAKTLHSLLGAKGSSGRFKYHKENKLPFDIIIIDEASMLDINLWIRLIRAVPEGAQLILVGDKNQLASVEAGSIFGDICNGSTNEFSPELSKVISVNNVDQSDLPLINDCIIELEKSYRFDDKSGINKLSKSILSEDSSKAIELFEDSSFNDISLIEANNDSIQKLIKNYVLSRYDHLKESKFSFEGVKTNQIICVLRKGAFGVEYINELAERKLKSKLSISISTEWYEGRAIIFSKNNSLLRIRNGEIGICFKDEKNNSLQLKREGHTNEHLSISRLQNYEPAYALTIHKSQGSEYDHVAIVLSNEPNTILSKQLFYTAVTRARKSILVIGSKAIIKKTISVDTYRKSALKAKVWNN